MNVTDATGQTIPWRTASHIDNVQMADWMREIVNRLFTFHLRRDDLSFRDHLDRWMTASHKWDNLVLDTAFLDTVAELGAPRKG